MMNITPSTKHHKTQRDSHRTALEHKEKMGMTAENNRTTKMTTKM